ncbi:NAD-dependent epimerase/dehydratase family protein [Calycomorphotria hydatis]|uniref:CDP-paratose 2-epimerase n=1 Tax=Calycomorphotria hydatis TaxID=2528027 RepID=A0A517TEC8_9PLAN|nr:NAD-dependent epimerase/dehydratase family protein [Calycomorphotria hydatis]QDT66727.1 CDP-paratose 2-epimerase [Calycomorphotria hydatis]
MSICLVTGAAGLIGSEAVRFFSTRNYRVVGIDNDMRSVLFGQEASTIWSRNRIIEEYNDYQHYDVDIRDQQSLSAIFKEYSTDIEVIIHTAAQPSHDWAASDPLMDFSINASGTLLLLECCRQYCPDAVFIFTSTNKVYGDLPNKLPLVELETRWEIAPEHEYFEHGIDESMSIDRSTHSLFGVSKVAADLFVQEYGRYFGIKTGVFRGGCLTGGGHSGTELHGFLSYLMKCCLTSRPYKIIGHKGKQVRDNIHSSDLINMFWHFCKAPRTAAVYNAGGGRHSHCSLMEAITLCEQVSGIKMVTNYDNNSRKGDHIWYVSDTRAFQADYPDWKYQYDINGIIASIYEGWMNRNI